MSFDSIFDIITTSVTLASAVAAVTKTPTDDQWVGRAYKILDFIALNIGRAKDR